MKVTLHIGVEARKIVMTGESMTIGRSPACSELAIDDQELSRLHAVISRDGDEVRIVDQQSVNGTYINCELVPPEGIVLTDGDEIFMGNHTVMIVDIKQDPPVGPVAQSKTNFVLLFVAPVIVITLLIGAVVVNSFRSPVRGEHHEVPSPTPRTVRIDPTPAPTAPPKEFDISIDEANLSDEITERPVGTPRLYKSLSDEEKREFIKARAARIATMMGKRPYALTPDALEYIKFWLEAFAARVGNNRTGLWRGDTRFILQRGSIHAPVIIGAFKENRVPPVIGLYIPFIETEYTNIHSNNAAGAAGLFQFLGPTAEHYGVPSSERTDVAKMAPAAARYFRDNIMSFGDDSMSVALAIAGYNRAPESVKRDLRNVLSAANNEDKERNFWTLIANQGKLDHFFQSENKNYVPRFFAAAILGETPWAFGIEMRPLSTYTNQGAADAPNE
jgi:FHA domain-containing protein/transglycosylase-like protein with SLT domain